MEKEIIIVRTFDAPVTLVWEAWTKAENVSKWWGPKGFNTKVKKLDFRPGGQWEYVMIDEKGNEYPAIGVFREIVPFEKIISSDDFGEEFKSSTDMDLPKPMLFTTLFEDLGDKTKLTLIYEHASAEDRAKHEKMGVVSGWNSSLDKLAEYMIATK